MILNEKKRAEFEEASKPLVEWLNENCHPHTTVIVDCGSSELFEAVVRAKIEEFIKD